MRKGERPFTKTAYAHMSEKRAARCMLALGYCQVSRAYGHVARVDVSDDELLVRIGKHVGCSVAGTRGIEGWRDYYRRCVSEDVITDVPGPVMYMIRNPGKEYMPPDDELVEAIKEFGLVQV